MTEIDINDNVIKQTQETLGKYVKKPQLTGKLLKKPPFRFLHDIVKAVIKETGCFEGLYEPEELHFENIRNRDDKINFLQKLIDVVKATTKSSLKIRASKIVAGQEVERTNELLQLIAKIIEEKLDWKNSLKTVPNDGVKSGNKEIVIATKQTGIKTKEKMKEKLEKAVKEKISKEPRGKRILTSSPNQKPKSTTKVALHGKEKALTRQATFEKVPKEPKEKERRSKESNEKVRTTKKPDDKKHADTASVEDTTNVSQQENMKERRDKKDFQTDQTQADTSSPFKEDLQGVQNESKRPYSKAASELEGKQVTNLDEMVISGTSDNANENNDSRKSSANLPRKASHTGSIKISSGTKRGSLELDQVLENNFSHMGDSIKSVKTVSEKKSKYGDAELTETAQNQFTDLKAMIQDTKREPVLAHENSKDSVGSNQNSSITRPRTSLRPPSARPTSARPGAPRRRDKNIEIILQPNDQIKMSNINVKLESFSNLEDDGENLVIIEDATSATNLNEGRSTKDEKESLEQKGHLVQQILETQKELIQQSGEPDLKPEMGTMSTGQEANARQSSARQMNNLRDIIQNLTKSVNPFGKLMDFIPEDIDAMQLELNIWRDLYSQSANDLKREKSLTDSATEPLKMQLLQIEANVKEFSEMIDSSRVKILQNADKIAKMFLEQ